MSKNDKTYYKNGNSVYANGITVMAVPARELKIEHELYQRDPKWSLARAKRIAASWDWKACRVFECAPKDPKDGLYPTLDGGTRLTALGIKFPDLVNEDGTPVMVLIAVNNELKGIKDSAAAFRGCNNEARCVNRSGIYKATLCEGKRNHRAVNKALTIAGLHVEYGGGRPGINGVKCPANFVDAHSVLNSDHFNLLVDVLSVKHKGIADSRCLKGDCVSGLTHYLISRQTDSISDLRRNLMRISMDDVCDIVEKESPVNRAQCSRRNAYVRAFASVVG